jgi:hypothetical protein
MRYLLLFPEKEAKSISSASQKLIGYPNLGEADPGGVPPAKVYVKPLSSF